MDSLAEALELLSTDGRRPSNEVSVERVQKMWEGAFQRVSTEAVTKAVERWLAENKRGWPRVAELLELIQLSSPAKPTAELEEGRYADHKRHELRWAISILEDRSRFEGENYRHTIQTAEHYLVKYRYSSWMEAKSWLVPGWAPATVTEVNF